jgi:hypothetical protein
MNITGIEGIVENGQVRLLGNVTLPEKTTVYVVVSEPETKLPAKILSPRLVNREQIGDFAKQVLEAPLDATI